MTCGSPSVAAQIATRESMTGIAVVGEAILIRFVL